VWSAGVVAWELVAGERLFADENEAAALLRIISKPAPRVRSVRPDVPPALDDAIAAALEIDPSLRPPTAEAFRARLRDAFSEIAETAEVSAYVMRLVGPQVAERHAAAASMPEILDARTSRPLIVAPPPSVTDMVRRPRVPQIVAAAFGVTLALVVAVILLAGRAISSARARAAASGSSVAAPPPSAVPVDPAPVALPSAQADPPRAPTELRLTANAPIARVVVNGRIVAADPVARELALELAESEEDVSLRITATAADGRVARATVPAGAREATIAFRKSATSAASAPAASAAPPAAPTAPKLHPSPYASGQ
jgi:hypothetical protein